MHRRDQLSFLEEGRKITPPTGLLVLKSVENALTRTGEFINITRGYRFHEPGKHINYGLHHHVYAERKDEDQGSNHQARFLFLVYERPLGDVQRLEEKVQSLTKNKIAVCPILIPGEEVGFYRSARGKQRPALWQLSREERERAREVTREELFWNECTAGNVPYVVTQEPMQLAVYDLSQHVHANYQYSGPPNVPREVIPPGRDLKKVCLPQLKGRIKNFTVETIPKNKYRIAIPIRPEDDRTGKGTEQSLRTYIQTYGPEVLQDEERLAIIAEQFSGTPEQYQRILKRINL